MIVPAGVNITIIASVLHRRPDIWGPDAEEFNPDRFSPEHSNERDPYSFIPFSLGQRGCIGQKYAKFSMCTFIAHFLMKYQVATDLKMEDLKFNFDFTIRYKNPVYLKLTLR